MPSIITFDTAPSPCVELVGASYAGLSRALGVFFNHFVELCVPFLIIFNPPKRLMAWFAINLTALMPWSHSALYWLGNGIVGVDAMAEGYSVAHCAVAALSGFLLGGRSGQVDQTPILGDIRLLPSSLDS